MTTRARLGDHIACALALALALTALAHGCYAHSRYGGDRYGPNEIRRPADASPR